MLQTKLWWRTDWYNSHILQLRILQAHPASQPPSISLLDSSVADTTMSRRTKQQPGSNAPTSAPLQPTQPSAPSFSTSIMQGAHEFQLDGVNFNNVSGNQHNTSNNNHSTVKDSYNRRTTNNRNEYKTNHRGYRANYSMRNNAFGRTAPQAEADSESDGSDGFDAGNGYDESAPESEESDFYEEEQQERALQAPRRAVSDSNRLLLATEPVDEVEAGETRLLESSYSNRRGKPSIPHSVTEPGPRQQKEPAYSYVGRTNVRESQSKRAHPPPPRPANGPTPSRKSFAIPRPAAASKAKSPTGSQSESVPVDHSELESDAVANERTQAPPRPSRTSNSAKPSSSTPSAVKGSTPTKASANQDRSGNTGAGKKKKGGFFRF
ncbi:hypothetical protein D9758_007687 [Tetrapyrgos nigripes]|uniref:Uncharacterized protein n=1 Tax=Tetrapyrgos nigripes TaxID=182062 RepID=A0A8H5G5F0_9AGAR|nr:hypothetical protein D9758_007687 [Tetrapyrgos nigripes]